MCLFSSRRRHTRCALVTGVQTCALPILPLRLTLLVPAVENAIGPDAFRPGEVVATRKGVSVEIDNTDAEGRVILADALALAGELEPALLLDFATQIGRASCRERVCQYVSISVVAVLLKKQNTNHSIPHI